MSCGVAKQHVHKHVLLVSRKSNSSGRLVLYYCIFTPIDTNTDIFNYLYTRLVLSLHVRVMQKLKFK